MTLPLMTKTTLIAVTAFVLASATAEARCVPTTDVMRPCAPEGVASPQRERSAVQRHSAAPGLTGHREASHGSSHGNIGVSGGPRTHVAHVAAGPLQCVLDGLRARGYPVRFIRGFGHGSVRGSLHPAGLALDVNQVSRGRTIPHMPRDEIAMANACGVISGAQWANNDSGHFQLGGYDGSARRRGHRNHHRHRRPR